MTFEVDLQFLTRSMYPLDHHCLQSLSLLRDLKISAGSISNTTSITDKSIQSSTYNYSQHQMQQLHNLNIQYVILHFCARYRYPHITFSKLRYPFSYPLSSFIQIPRIALYFHQNLNLVSLLYHILSILHPQFILTTSYHTIDLPSTLNLSFNLIITTILLLYNILCTIIYSPPLLLY